jgi:hypothetical protein
VNFINFSSDVQLLEHLMKLKDCICWLAVFCPLLFISPALGSKDRSAFIDFGLTSEHFQEGQTPQGWRLRKGLFGVEEGGG